MAEIKINADMHRLIEEDIVSPDIGEGLETFVDLLEVMPKLYQVVYEVPEEDIATILTDFYAFGETEPLQVNTWWTPTENWPVDKMLEVGSYQIVLAIHQLKLPENMLVSSTIEQKGVDHQLNKTIFVYGYKDEQGIIHITQEKPQLDESAKQIIIDGRPQYESVEIEYTQEDVKKLIDKLNDQPG